MARTIVPEFSKFRQEEALIGKLVIGYGELEFALARAVQWIIDDEDIALRWLYKSRGESQRISTAEALTFHVLRGHSLETMFAQAVDAMKHCLAIRNQYAHATWTGSGRVLRFTSLEGLIHQSGKVSTASLKMKSVTPKILHLQERYFVYTLDLLTFINFEFQREGGYIASHPYAKPSKVSRPNL